MTALIVSLLGAICIFGGALCGMYIRDRLPDHHLREDSRDTIKVGAAMLATLSALVLGLLVSSSKQTFDTIGDEVTQSAAKTILLDRLLENYGPETQLARNQLRESMVATVERIWPDNERKEPQLSALEHVNYLEGVQKSMLALTPSTESQKVFMSEAQALVAELRQTRWLIVEQEHGRLPPLFLVVLIFWLTVNSST